MFHLFYRIFLESVLANETIAKEDIIAIESIRQKYRIPLTDHLSILSEIEDGVTIYTRHLARFSTWRSPQWFTRRSARSRCYTTTTVATTTP